MARVPVKKAEKIEKPESIITCIEILSGAEIPARNFYILSGKDHFAFAKIIESLEIKFLSDDPSGYNKAVFNCENNTKASVFLNVCEEYPFGSKYKMVVVYDSQKLSAAEGERVKRYLEDPSPTTILILIHYEEDSKNTPAGKFNALRSLKSAVQKNGLHISSALEQGHVRNWIRSRFETEGKKISPTSLELLVSTVGTDLWDLYQEIEKLVLYTGKKGVITDDDVRTLTSVRPQSKIFNFNEEVGSKRIQKALVILDELMRDMVGPQVLAALQNHFSFLFKIRSLLDKGENTEEIAKKLRKHPFYIKKSAQQAMNFNLESYDSIFDLISRADAGMKTGLEDRWVIELTLIQICKMKG
jgi:DNA polymerase-3 subunit delta